MRIVDAKWTPRVNMLIIKCTACDRRFEHRADRWQVRCECGQERHLGALRERMLADIEHKAR